MPKLSDKKLAQSLAVHKSLVEVEIEKRKRHEKLIGYRSDPNAYVSERLGMTFWSKQAQAAQALIEPPHRVLIESANGVGKTAFVGAIVSWMHDCYNPGICIVTSPRYEQVEQVTFKEIRRHLGERPGMAPKAAFLRDNPHHFIQGTTATDSTAFQGHHDAALMVVFEEATGIDPAFWESTRGMLQGGTSTFWLAILNPTSTDSQAYIERTAVHPDGSRQWTVIRISAFEHPNVIQNLRDLPKRFEGCDRNLMAALKSLDDVIPGAVNLRGVVENMTSDETWGTWVDETIYNSETDVDFWDGSIYGLDTVLPPEILQGVLVAFPKRYWHPGPIGESRLLGRYPSQALYSVFGEELFDYARNMLIIPTDPTIPEMGCDVARYGDDKTIVVAQRGGRLLKIERRAKIGTDLTAQLLKDMCDEMGRDFEINPRRIPVRVDDSGVGGGVVDQAGDYNFIPIVAQSKDVMQPHLYPDKRSEMMFHLAGRLRDGTASLMGIGPAEYAELVKQATKVRWKPDSQGRRRVLSKQQVKDKLGGRSPDELDAFGLAYYRLGQGTGPKAEVPVKAIEPLHRRQFGMGSSRLFRSY